MEREHAPLLGRETALDAVLGLLEPGRLVSIVGLGGIGKTRVAREIAARRLAAGDACVFVDLAPIGTADAVSAELASILGASEDADRQLVHAIAAILAERQTLVVLDNFEHVLAARDDVRTILRLAPTTTVLTTSRIPLGLANERIAELDRLVVPNSPADLEIAPASGVFLRRARDLGRLTSVEPADAVAIVEICRRLDGLPLALELAAGWTRTLSPRAILRRLIDGRLDLGGGSDARQASVEAVVTATLDLLGPRQRATFPALAIFAGAFDEPAARTVTGDDDVIATLRSVAAIGLIEVGANESGEPLFWLLETIRGVARARNAGVDNLGASQRRYVSLYADRAVEAANAVRTSSFSAASAGETLDDPNIQGAFAQAVALGDGENALRIAAALASRGMQTGILREPLARLRATITLADVAGGTRSDALNAIVSLRGVLGDTVGLVADAREALALARAAGSPEQVVRTLITVGNWSGPDAAPLYEEAAELAEQTAYSWGAATAWESLAMAYWDANRPTDALRALDRAQTSQERRGDRAGVAAALSTRGAYELVLGQTAAALEHLDRAVVILRDDPGLPFLVTLASTLRATAQSLAGRTDDAIRSLSAIADRAAVAESALDVDEWLASAAIVLQDRHPALAARCIGAVERVVAEHGTPRADQRLLDAAQRRVEVAIGRHRFEVERAAGHGTERGLLFARIARVVRRESGPSRGGLLAPFGALSVREQEVLARLADGRTDREIATELGMSPKTASVHVANLKAKIGVATRVEVGLYGRERLGRQDNG